MVPSSYRHREVKFCRIYCISSDKSDKSIDIFITDHIGISKLDDKSNFFTHNNLADDDQVDSAEQVVEEQEEELEAESDEEGGKKEEK